MTPPLKSYIVRVKRTVIEDYELTARDESHAKEAAEKGWGDFCNVVETVDIEVESVEESE